MSYLHGTILVDQLTFFVWLTNNFIFLNLTGGFIFFLPKYRNLVFVANSRSTWNGNTATHSHHWYHQVCNLSGISWAFLSFWTNTTVHFWKLKKARDPTYSPPCAYVSSILERTTLFVSKTLLLIERISPLIGRSIIAHWLIDGWIIRGRNFRWEFLILQSIKLYEITVTAKALRIFSPCSELNGSTVRFSDSTVWHVIN